MSMDQYRGELSIKEAVEGMNAARRNAKRLAEDARLLLEAGRYANGYLLQRTKKPHFSIDTTAFKPDVPVPFEPDELADEWVRIRPERASTFSIFFADETPRRLFVTRQLIDES